MQMQIQRRGEKKSSKENKRKTERIVCGRQVLKDSLVWLGLSTRTEKAQKLTWKVSCVLGDLSALTFAHPMPTDNTHSSIRGKVPDSCTDFTSTWTLRDCPCITDNFKSFLKSVRVTKMWFRETPTGWCWEKHLTWRLSLHSLNVK